MTWPIANNKMEQAPRGGGNQSRNGGKPLPKPLPYTPPKGPKGIHGGAQTQNLGNCGTQHKG